MQSRDSQPKLLSIIIPTYNESNTLGELLKKVEQSVLPPGIDREIIIVDDGSTDDTNQILNTLSEPFMVMRHAKNLGKGASVIDGLKASKGDFIIIQDADLEYDPNDYGQILQPIIDGISDVVYGSRFLDKSRPIGMRLISKIANHILTIWSNIFTGLKIQDMETCYKMMSREVVDSFKDKLISNGFGIEPEITSYIKKYRIVEVPISYNGRSVNDGKKVNWKDGVGALYDIARFNTSLQTKRVISFLIAGGIGAVTIILSLYIFTEIVGLWYLLSATLSFILASLVSFFLQKLWTFKDTSTDRFYSQLTLYFILAVINLAINDAIIYILVEYTNTWYIFAQICASAIIAIWSFFLYKKLFTSPPIFDPDKKYPARS